MRPLRTIACLLLLSACIGAGDDPETPPDRTKVIRPAGAPMVMAYLREPSLTVVGADSPAFALYDDGTVIFRSIRGDEKDDRGGRGGFRAVKLTAEELAALKNDLGIADLRRPKDAAINANEKQVPVDLVVKDGDGFFAVRVAQIESRRAVAGVSTMLSYDHPNAVAWMPDEVQVLLWPAAEENAESIPWPADWPKLDRAVEWKLPVHAEQDRPPTEKIGYSLPLEMTQIAKLRSILRTSAHRRPVEIEGKKFLLTYRLPFPGERPLGQGE